MNGEVVRVYSLSKDGNTRPYMANGKRCTNFKVSEFACQDKSDVVFICPELVTILQDVRTHFGKAVNVSGHSAYRTPQHNKKVGGSASSYHLYAMAADFHVSGVSHKEVYNYLDSCYPYSCGIGLYSWGVHIDSRRTKSRWNG